MSTSPSPPARFPSARDPQRHRRIGRGRRGSLGILVDALAMAARAVAVGAPALVLVLDMGARTSSALAAASTPTPALTSSLTPGALSTPLAGSAAPSAEGASPGVEGPPAETLAGRLDAILAASPLRASQVGIRVALLPGGEVLYDHEGDRLLTPASLQKLMTSAAGLSLLGPQVRFETQLLAAGRQRGGLLEGDLCLRGRGDPTLSPEDLAELARAVARAGVHEVGGGLLLDAGYFQGPMRPSGWAWDDLGEAYAALPSALAAAGDVVEVEVAPGPRANAPLHLTLRPPGRHVEVVAEAATTLPGKGSELALIANPPMSDHRERWKVRGALAPGDPPQVLARAVAEPPFLAGDLLREALAKAGVRVRGASRMASAPPGARLLAAHLGPPLADLVRMQNKESDNLLAETLLLHLGGAPVIPRGGPSSSASPLTPSNERPGEAGERTSPAGSRDRGLAAVRRFLARMGWAEGAYAATDGSGLSPHDACTPAQLVSLLVGLPRLDPTAHAALLVSLPVAGVDGTLAGRLREDAAMGELRAKTGTLTGVSGLAGYLSLPDGRTLALAIMVNGYVAPPAEARKLQDQLVSALYAAPRPPLGPPQPVPQAATSSSNR